jgi:hypothetical protein
MSATTAPEVSADDAAAIEVSGEAAQPIVSAEAAIEGEQVVTSEVAERVRRSTQLPPVLKERLAQLVEASGKSPTGAPVAVSCEEAVRAVEEALPDFVLGQRSPAAQPEHPGGDRFFSGDPRDLSDAEAEEIARRQLARSGLLRGQRARVAD